MLKIEHCVGKIKGFKICLIHILNNSFMLSVLASSCTTQMAVTDTRTNPPVGEPSNPNLDQIHQSFKTEI